MNGVVSSLAREVVSAVLVNSDRYDDRQHHRRAHADNTRCPLAAVPALLSVGVLLCGTSDHGGELTAQVRVLLSLFF